MKNKLDTKIDLDLSKKILNTKVRLIEQHSSIETSNETILFGNTGSGKTSLSCVLSGKDVKIYADAYGATELKYQGINGGCVSETEIPNIMVDKSNDMTFIDNPGFEDTKGYTKEIENAFATHDLINANKKETKAKILLVIRACEIGAARSENLQKLFTRIDAMFPNMTESDKKAVGIVITCEPKNRPPVFYINLLRKNAEPSTSKWCEYFMSHQDQLFTVPEADYCLNGQTFDFEDKSKLLEFIKKDQIVNPKPKLTLSPEAKLYLKYSFQMHVEDIINEAEKIINTTKELYKSEANIGELNKWSTNIDKILQTEIKDPENVKEAFQQNIIDEDDDFKRSFQRLDSLNALHLFFTNILEINAQDIHEKITKPISEKIKKMKADFDVYKEAKIKEDKAKKEAQEAKAKADKEKADKEKAEAAARQAKLEKERADEAARPRLEFLRNNRFKDKKVHKDTKPKLGTGHNFSVEEYEKRGICYDLGKSEIMITTNSCYSSSSPYNTIDADDDKNYWSEDKYNSYIQFDFLARKVKLDYIRIQDSRNDKYCLIKGRIEARNENEDWVVIATIDDDDGTTPRSATGHWYHASLPWVSKDDEYKLYYKYIRIIQTGYSYNSNNYEMEIKRIDFYGEYTEPVI